MVSERGVKMGRGKKKAKRDSITIQSKRGARGKKGRKRRGGGPCETQTAEGGESLPISLRKRIEHKG